MALRTGASTLLRGRIAPRTSLLRPALAQAAAPSFTPRHDVRSQPISSSARASHAMPKLTEEMVERLAREKAEKDAAIAEGKQYLAERGYDVETIWEQTVIWGDHDQFQHVNNVRYLQWYESARMHWAATLASKLPENLASDIVKGTGESFILAGANIRFKRPVVYPDTILVGSTVLLPLNATADRFMLRGAAYSVKQKTIVSTCDQDCVSYDYRVLKKAPLGPQLRTLIEEKGTTEWK